MKRTQTKLLLAQCQQLVKEGQDKQAIEKAAQAIQSDPRYIETFKQVAQSLLDDGKFERSVLWFDKALEAEPYEIGLYGEKGSALQDLGRDEEALACYEKAISMDPNQGMFYHDKAIILSKKGKLDEAEKNLKKAAELNPSLSESSNVIIATNMVNTGRIGEALELFDRVLSTVPNSIMALTYKGKWLNQLKKFDEALPCFEKLLSLDPHNIEFYYEKWVALLWLGKEAEAEKVYSKMKSIDPEQAKKLYMDQPGRFLADGEDQKALRMIEKEDSPELKSKWVYRDLSIELRRGGKLERSLFWYDKAIELDPNEAKLYADKAISLLSLGRLEEALEHNMKALDLDPRMYQIYNNMGGIYIKLNKNDEGLECFRKAAELDPEHSEPAYLNMGDVLAQLNRIPEAIEAYDKASLAAPKSDTALKSKLRLMLEAQRAEESLECIDRLIALDPRQSILFEVQRTLLMARGNSDPSKSVQHLFRLHLEKREDKKAIKALEKALLSDPNIINLIKQTATELRFEKEYKRSLLWFDKAIEIDPDDFTQYVDKGISLLSLERTDEALKSIEKGLSLNPKSVLALSNKAAILVKQKMYNEALECLRKAREFADHKSIELVNTNMATVLVDLGRVGEAIEAISEIIKAVPTSADSYIWKGKLLMGERRDQEALDCFKQLISINPEHSHLIRTAGAALMMNNEAERTLWWYDRYLEIDPKCSITNHMKKSIEEMLQAGKGALDLAREAYENICKMKPGNDQEAIMRQAKLEEAIKLYDAAIDEKDREWLLLAMKGQALTELQRKKKAKVCFSKAVKSFSDGFVRGDFWHSGTGFKFRLSPYEVELCKYLKERFPEQSYGLKKPKK